MVVTMPDGSAKTIKDPRPDSFSMDMLITVAGQGQATEGGFTLGGTKVKIGTAVEIDQKNYNFSASVIDVRYGDALKEQQKVSLIPDVAPAPDKINGAAEPKVATS